MSHKKIISASILAADFAKLGEECQQVITAGTDYIHFDVMDHHFVPNLSFGAVVCKSLRNAGITAPIDVHLMVTEPENYIEAFAKAGANMLTFHPETVTDVMATIKKIHAAGMQAGLAFNPEKPVDLSTEILNELSMLLIMSVNPGFAGQSFMPESLDKLRDTRRQLDAANTKAWLGIDGGVKLDNITEISQAGADFFILGSGIFSAKDYTQQLDSLRLAIK